MNQSEKLKCVQSLLSCFPDHPRYKDFPKENFSLEHFHSLPILNKIDLINDLKHIQRKNICHISSTSGTTQKLLVTHSKQAYESICRRGQQILNSTGVQPGDIVMNLLPYQIDAIGRCVEDMLKRYVGVGVIPMGDWMNHAMKKEVVSLIEEFSPTVVTGYTNQMADFFAFLTPYQHQIKTCLMGGEPLTKTFQEQLQNMYHIDVYNVYAATEFGFLAVGQSHEDEFLDLLETNLWFEVLHDDGSVSETGEGDIVITDLENISTPFIRYRLGNRVKITQQGLKKKIQILGRSGGTFLYGAQIYSLAMVETVTQQLLNSKNFLYVIQKNAQLYQDMMILYTEVQDQDCLAKMKQEINQKLDFGDFFFVKTYHGDWPKTSAGKRRFLIDTRENE